MSLRIVFMGTPDFAVPSLDALFQNGYPIVGVVTATDKMGGRGCKQLIQSAVKRYAVEKGMRVLQPTNLKHPDFLEELRSLGADLQVVVAFRMLPEEVWNMPPLGTINLHGSLLPAYRGAAPIHWAVMNGEKRTGVTSFFLKHEIDTGDILLSAPLDIGPNECTGEVHDRMMYLGAETVLKSVQLIESGRYTLLPQDNSKVSKAPKLFRETCEINFDRTTAEVHNFIRGLSPFPLAWTLLDGEDLKIIKAEPELSQHSLPPGKLVTDYKNHFKYATKDGYIRILELKPAGKRAMTVKDFLNGYKKSND
jgi:methionyl-tRNA formyltransferase